VIDEVGYLTLDPLQSSLLFQVICQRYQRGQPIALTSNKAFSDWGQIFADGAVLATATLDRPLHRSTIINIRGES
jgi:DNA replication protein DnaC